MGEGLWKAEVLGIAPKIPLHGTCEFDDLSLLWLLCYMAQLTLKKKNRLPRWA